MFRSSGEFLWRDSTVNPGAVYHSILGAGEPISMVFGPHSVSGQHVPTCSGWTVADPETDMGEGNRLVFDYIMDEPGNPMLAVGDGKLLMGSYSSCAVYAIDIATGEKVWETWTQTAMGYMTSYHDGVFFIGTQSMHIYALDSEDGSVLWHNTDGVRNRAFNVWNINYAYGNVYLHDLDAGTTGAQKCLDAETGVMKWASPALFYIGYYTTVVADGKVFGRQSDYSTTTGREATPINFACWDAFTGEVLWEIQEDIASPMIAYGCLYFMKGGQLWALSTAVEPNDYAMWRGNAEMPSVTLDKGPTDLSSPKWVFTTGAGVISSPVISDGKLYVGSYDNKVYCFEDRTIQNMAISASVDKSSVSLADAETVTVTAKLTGAPWTNVYADIGAEAPVPPMADTEILVTYTDPDGAETDMTATTDENGVATATFTPDAVGEWKVIAWYMGAEGAVSSRTYAFSDESLISVVASTGPAPSLVTSVTPTASNIKVGESVVLTASVSGGTADFTYQWYQIVSGTAVPIPGETSATLTVAPSTEGTYGYFCEVTDAAEQVDSSDTAEVKVAAESARPKADEKLLSKLTSASEPSESKAVISEKIQTEPVETTTTGQEQVREDVLDKLAGGSGALSRDKSNTEKPQTGDSGDA